MTYQEHHRVHRIGWLRASVLGANDGIVSTASLIIGVAAAGASESSILLAGVAGLVAGAMSMASGEYVSVSSQADTEKADLELERASLEHDFDSERDELASIYEGRGLQPELAVQVGRLAVETAVFPLYEVEYGKYNITYKLDEFRPLRDYLKVQGRFRHLSDHVIDASEERLRKEYKLLRAKVRMTTEESDGEG